MSLSDGTMVTMPVAPASTCATGSNGGWGGFGGDGAWWIIILFLFVFCGWGNNGWGNNGGAYGSQGGVMDGYVLTSDFANLERKLDGVNNGLCDGFYAVNTSFGNLNNTLATNFAAVQNTMTAQGYENRIATNGVASQLAQCCCDTKADIADTKYALAMNTNALQSQLAQCCCDTSRQIERGFCDTNYNNQSQHFQTMQAIDKVGDRVIDFMAQREAQSLRDENQALRLAASQAAQNNYLVGQLRPCPVPAYTVQNPFCCNSGVNFGGCGCA